MPAKKKKSSAKKAVDTKKENMTSDLMALVPTGISLTENRPGYRKRTVNLSPKPKNSWDLIKIKKKQPVLSPTGLVELFRSQIRANLASKISYRPDISADQLAAEQVLDILISNQCENETTARAWVEWYVKEYIKGRSSLNWDLLKMSSLLQSWAEFEPVRPSAVTEKVIIESKKVNPANPSVRTIRMELFQELGSKPTISQIEKMLQLFGIMVVGNYLLAHQSLEQVVRLLDQALEKIHNSMTGKYDVQMIFKMTERYFVNKKDLAFLDWQERYRFLWDWAICSSSSVNVYYTKRAEEFFNEV